MTKRTVFFNHKGGVSKTTSVYNIGWMLAKKYKVLIVDADPQCNLSSLILREDFDRYYTDESTKHQNIMDGVQVAFTARPFPIKAVNCFSPASTPSLYLLAGHANLSEYDAALTFAQTNNTTSLQNLPGAFSELIKLTEEKYDIDYTLIDLNPGLGAISQNLFLSAHTFVIPTNPDPFSLMAIDTLKKVLPRWALWKRNSIQTFAESAYPLLPEEPKFIGSLIQLFNTHSGNPAHSYTDNIPAIKSKIQGEFFSSIAQAGMALDPKEYIDSLSHDGYCLSEIPDFLGLLPKSYQFGVPVFELSDSEINEGNESKLILDELIYKRDVLKQQFQVLGEKLIELLSYA